MRLNNMAYVPTYPQNESPTPSRGFINKDRSYPRCRLPSIQPPKNHLTVSHALEPADGRRSVTVFHVQAPPARRVGPPFTRMDTRFPREGYPCTRTSPPFPREGHACTRIDMPLPPGWRSLYAYKHPRHDVLSTNYAYKYPQHLVRDTISVQTKPFGMHHETFYARSSSNLIAAQCIDRA
jgi:hypothetical protein